MIELAPEVWSDIDGTALEKLSAKNPRHWYRNGLKRNLAGMQGYSDFLRGVQSEGVVVAGLVSKRYEWMRRRTTARSVSQVGLTGFFGEGNGRVILAGGEKAKGRFVGERSRGRMIGMLEDRPHKFVKGLIHYATSVRNGDDTPQHHPILVGVVDGDGSRESVETLRNYVEYSMQEDVHVRDEIGTNSGLVVYADPLTIHVTQLGQYSQASGEEFAQRLHSLAE